MPPQSSQSLQPGKTGSAKLVNFTENTSKMNNNRHDDNYFMRQALKEAHAAAEKGEVPIGAVVVCDGAVIARGHNLVECLGDATAHAEMQAITSAAAAIGGKYLEGCTLYVTGEPCPMCAAACYWARPERIVYGASDPKRGYTTVSDKMLHPRTSVTSGVEKEECERLMSEFFKGLRR